MAWTVDPHGPAHEADPDVVAVGDRPLAVVLLAFTVVRNLPGPLHWLNSATA